MKLFLPEISFLKFPLFLKRVVFQYHLKVPKHHHCHQRKSYNQETCFWFSFFVAFKGCRLVLKKEILPEVGKVAENNKKIKRTPRIDSVMQQFYQKRRSQKQSLSFAFVLAETPMEAMEMRLISQSWEIL